MAILDRILLDAGPLLTLLALGYLRNAGADRARCRSVLTSIRPQYPPEDFEDRFRQLLGRSHLATSTHVLAEVFKLREHSILKRVDYNFRRSALDELRKIPVQELYCVASDLSSKESIHRLCQIGLTDATLLHIAMEKGYVILSDDRRLRDAGLGYVRLLDSLLSEKQD